MSENTTGRDPLANIEAFEAGAFRVAHVGRHLLADHAALPLHSIRPAVSAYQDPASTHARLEISARSVDGVRQWAKALGTTVTVRFYDGRGNAQAFEHHEALTEVGGVEVSVVGSRRDLTEVELAAWRSAPTNSRPLGTGGGN